MSNVKRTRDIQFDRPMRLAGIVGVAAAVLAVVGLFVSGADAFFQAYLFAFVFWLGISLGLLGLLLLHHLMGTHWGLTIRRVAEAGASSVWVLGVLFLPLLFGLERLFPWARAAEVDASYVLQEKTFYLNVPFFILRGAIYFAVWLALAYFANRLTTRAAQGRANPVEMRERGQRLGAAGLILYVLTMTFAAIDWLMSLQPFWSSTIFGLLIIVGQILTAMAFAVAALNLFPSLSLGRRWTSATTPVPFSDLGALMFTFVFGWAYLAYFQMAIIWSADIPREVVWYTDRIQGGWNVVAVIIAVFQFVLPFLILLSGRVRHNLRLLGGMGAALLVANLINIFWHVKPAFYPGQFAISWLDIVLPVAVGGLWLAAFLYHLARRPALTAVEETALHLRDEVRA